MTIRFHSLFTVAVTHSYYASACSDLEFVTPPATANQLYGGRMLARVLDGRLHVLFEADAHGAPINSLAGSTLVFGLQLVNPYFDNFTAPVVSDVRLLPFYANRTNSTALDAPSGVILTSGVYTHTPQSAARPLTLRLSSRDGAVVAAQTLAAGDAAGSFDLRTVLDGAYRIDEDAGGGSVAAALLYVSSDFRNAGVWGILAVKIDASMYAAPGAFSINFAARQELLKYFVVARNFAPVELDKLVADLNVSDQGFNDEHRAEVSFDKVPPADFTAADIALALLDDGTGRVVMFRSQVAVARRERGLRKIQLNRNGDVLIEHLPQPGADRAQANLIVHLTKPS